MTVFQQVLWMFVNIRVLGKQPRLPLPRESLIQYAVALELQYSRICMRVGTARRREAAAIAWRIVGLLGLTEAAEPLPRRLLVLLERQSRLRSGCLLFRVAPPRACGIPSDVPLPQGGNPPRAIHWIARPLQGEQE
jgi:hypothetical protein